MLIRGLRAMTRYREQNVAMKISLISLGCAKNLIDSEQMLALIASAGHELVSDPSEAEAVVVNTCAFIEAAQQEAIDTILSLAELKKTGSLRKLIVTGCLPQRYSGEILKEIPEIDAVLGTGSFPEILTALETNEPHFARFADQNAPLPDLPRAVSTGPGWAYLKIADGCDNHCAYCVIPSIRGRYRSRPMDSILEEARTLAASGVKEIILVAQDVTCYGLDLRDGTNLCALLRALAQVEGISWIRMHYLYPNEIDEALLDTIASESKVLPYLDVPIQHVNDRILHRMHRPETEAGIRNLFDRIRQKLPEAVIRTSLIVGLPGEGEAEFQQLLDFLQEQRLPRVGVFVYSPQEGTAAVAMLDRCSPEEAQSRWQRVMDLQNTIMDAYDRDQIGKEFTVLCTELQEDGRWSGRCYADAPDVDEMVLFTGPGEPGQFVRVHIDALEDGCLAGHRL